MVFNGDLMVFNGIYHLVMTNIAMENHTGYRNLVKMLVQSTKNPRWMRAIFLWLVVSTYPLWKIWVSNSWDGDYPIYYGKIKAMFQTTNQLWNCNKNWPHEQPRNTEEKRRTGVFWHGYRVQTSNVGNPPTWNWFLPLGIGRSSEPTPILRDSGFRFSTSYSLIGILAENRVPLKSIQFHKNHWSSVSQ